jgi:hypothetical protein
LALFENCRLFRPCHANVTLNRRLLLEQPLTPGAFAIETPQSEEGNPGFDGSSALIVPGCVRTTSVQDAMTKLNTAFNNNGGSPIQAALVGHGRSSQINVGKAQHGPLNGADGLYLLDNNQWVQNFCNGVNGVPGLNGKITLLFATIASHLRRRQELPQQSQSPSRQSSQGVASSGGSARDGPRVR